MNTVSSSYLRTIFNGCCEVGEHQEALVSDLTSKLPERGRNLENPTFRYESRLAAELLNTAVKFTGDTAVGVKIATKLRPQTLLDIGYAFTLCDNLSDVIKLNIAYQPLIQQAGTTRLDLLGQSAWMKWTPLYTETDFYAQLVETIFASYASIGRWLLWGEDDPVLSMHFRHSAPESIDFQKGIFGDRIYYGAEFDGVEFKGSAMTVPMPNRNPELLQLLKQRLDTQLAELNAPKNITQETMRCIQSALRERKPQISQIAAIMGMSERTLRRRLLEEKQTFRTVLERARKENCEIYMRAANINQADMALRLGYKDQSAFSRAFKNWFDQTPREYLQALDGEKQLRRKS